MSNSKKDKISKCKTFDELLDVEYGKKGSATRDKFETDAAVLSRIQVIKDSCCETNSKSYNGMEITELQYEAALQRIEELLPLVSDETPRDDKNLIELLDVSAIVEAYEDIHYPIGDEKQQILP